MLGLRTEIPVDKLPADEGLYSCYMRFETFNFLNWHFLRLNEKQVGGSDVSLVTVDVGELVFVPLLDDVVVIIFNQRLELIWDQDCNLLACRILNCSS